MASVATNVTYNTKTPDYQIGLFPQIAKRNISSSILRSDLLIVRLKYIKVYLEQKSTKEIQEGFQYNRNKFYLRREESL